MSALSKPPYTDDDNATQHGHWSRIAQQWQRVGPPLRPSACDVAVFTKLVHAWSKVHGPCRALILGVTPELYRLPWPEGAEVSAVDHTPEMIEAVWPGPRQTALCGEWSDLPLETGSRDIVLCDGGLHLLSYPDDQRRLVRELHRVLGPHGQCIFRLFVPPSARETPEEVLRDLFSGHIANTNILKLRLGMALQPSCEQGVCLGEIWEVLHRTAPDLERLAQQLDWPVEQLLAVHSYRGSANRYHFPNLYEVEELFCHEPGGFEWAITHVPAYALGERCPIVALGRVATPLARTLKRFHQELPIPDEA